MTDTKINKPVLGFAAYSGTGKTTLLINIIPLIKARRLQNSCYKTCSSQL